MKMLLVAAFLIARMYAATAPLTFSEAPPTADVLRGPYQVDQGPAPVVADVLRGPYGLDEEAVPMIADVLRMPYEGNGQPVAEDAVVVQTPSEGYVVSDVLRYPYEFEDHQGAAPVLAFIEMQQAEAAKQSVPAADGLVDEQEWHRFGH